MPHAGVAASRRFVSGRWRAAVRAALPWLAVGGAAALGHRRDAIGAGVLLIATAGLARVARRMAWRVVQRAPAGAAQGTAVRQCDGRWAWRTAAELRRGDVARVDSAACVVADGRVLDGGGRVDEAAITGDGRPCGKRIGDRLYAGSINLGAALTYRIDAVADATLAARLASGRMRAFARSLGMHRRLRLGVSLLLAAVAAAALPTLSDALDGDAAYRALVWLALAWNAALRMCAPCCAAAALLVASRRGIAVSGIESLRRAARATVVDLDEPPALAAQARVVDWQLLGVRRAPRQLLAAARALGARARAPLAALAALDAPLRHASACACSAAGGVQGRVDGVDYRLGDPEWALRGMHCSAPLDALLELHRARGRCVALLADGAGALALFALERAVPVETAQAIDALHAFGVRGIRSGGKKPGPGRLRVAFGTAARGLAPDVADLVVVGDAPTGLADALRLARRTDAALRCSVLVALAGKLLAVGLALAGALTMSTALGVELASMLGVLGSAAMLRRQS